MKVKAIIVRLCIFCALLCSMNSCNNKVERAIYGWNGWWTIDTIFYKDYEIRTCLLGNSFFFDKTEVKLPITKDYCSDIVLSYDDRGKWNMLKTDSLVLLMKIDTQNEIFSGTHRVRFRKDEENQLLKMELSSNNLFLICRKGMFDYYRNKDLIKELGEKGEFGR